MIRKLKIKFILTNMLLISVVMIAAFALLYWNTARELEENSLNTLQEITRADYRGLDSLFRADENNNSEYPYISTFIIQLNEMNHTFSINGFGDSQDLTTEEVEYINELINSVNKQNTSEGILEEYNMRYSCVDTRIGKRIALLDKRYEDDNLNRLLISFLISGVIAFTAFLIISVIVARIAVKPVERSINQQKQLISDISHELKTPITIISTNTDIVLSHNDSAVENERKWLGYIKDEANRMANLVNMMLYLAKNDEAEQKTVLSNIDLSNLAYEIVLPFETICYENKKTLNIDIESNVMIKGDENSIKQLIVILLDNAIKYSNENGRIDVSVHYASGKGVISVFNTGEPIPKDQIPLIFDRFYRLDKARSREKGGSGLGLSIAKRIIEQNEASISVSSDIDHGTVFTCSFESAKQKMKQKDNIQFT